MLTLRAAPHSELLAAANLINLASLEVACCSTHRSADRLRCSPNGVASLGAGGFRVCTDADLPKKSLRHALWLQHVLAGQGQHHVSLTFCLARRLVLSVLCKRSPFPPCFRSLALELL